jgi:hypothetical protein
MLDRTAIAEAPSRMTLLVSAVLIGVLALVPIVREPVSVANPCSMMEPSDHARERIETRTRELNPRYFARSRFADPMLAR